MEILIDSADIQEIRDAAAMGVIDGVTTNPTLVARSGRPLRAVIEEICTLVDGPISAEVLATESTAMVQEGRLLAAWHKNVVVKIPLIADGLRAVRTLNAEGIRTNVTLCFSASQALLAAKAGATYISPFVGRLDDVSQEGMQLIADIVTLYRHYGFATKVLVASVRHPVHVVQAAKLGAHAATLPHKVIHQLLRHPLTDAGLERFLADAAKAAPRPAGVVAAGGAAVAGATACARS
ncbi:MAG: fructose-6-phosphate aldolase [Polyangiales bacterium]